MKTSTSRRCNRSTPGAAATSSCSASVMPDPVSQSPTGMSNDGHAEGTTQAAVSV
ncbi:hypothetical protein J8Z82_21620 [Yersinia enterocolitica]|uniref:hypothetical protein n=1 Tax=Yersinia enterocolitica TaxID=630 RepID=UPI001C8D7CFA|nr:hypothetical protein [Yersinia enterocolitica]MBX9489377.1 hypothetical protein [Yersinia enterocolitica]MBX9494322.1 hypothetical protein [Yersinia enterocolitica]